MEYNKIKGADRLLLKSPCYVSNPSYCKGKWNMVFKNNNPIYLELGTGRGEMIIKMAKENPNINFIGVEINESQLATAVQKIGLINIPNLKLLCMDAHNIDNVFAKEIDTIYLTFSEPWPKPEEEKNRFTHLNYLKIYDKIYKKNKHLILKTDNKGLFRYSLESLSQYWYSFKKISFDLHHDDRQIPNIMTDFEKEYFKEGRPIYYVDATFDN